MIGFIIVLIIFYYRNKGNYDFIILNILICVDLKKNI